MMRRRAMMGRPVANVGRAVVGTAVVAGTAGAVHHHQQKKWAQKDAAAQQQYDQAYQQGAADAQQDAQMEQMAQQQAMQQQQQLDQMQMQAQQAPPAGAKTNEKIAQLQKLGELKTAAILTEEEFVAEKAKILAS